MLSQHTVGGYQPQPLDGTLSEQQTIKRVTRRRDRIDVINGMPMIDR
jgi:hypothetical protein